jgi:hypothetical protein
MMHGRQPLAKGQTVPGRHLAEKPADQPLTVVIGHFNAFCVLKALL